MAAAATSILIPLDVYLTTSYRPDCDWIEGELQERNVGEKPHSALQKFFILYLAMHETEWGILVWPEHRVQTSATHFRIPDICATRHDAQFDRIIDHPPILCVEIMSGEDRMSDLLERVTTTWRWG